MTFSIDNRIPKPKAAPESNTGLNDIADMILTRALLDAERVNSAGIKDEKGRVTVRIEHVFRSKDSLYIHYSLRNGCARPYRATTPVVTEASTPRSGISIVSLRYTQLDPSMSRKLGTITEHTVTFARSENQKQDLQPGEQTHGVVVIRQQVSSPIVFQLKFGPQSSGQVMATLVL